MSAFSFLQTKTYPSSTLDQKQVDTNSEVTTLCDSIGDVNLSDGLLYVDWLKPNPNNTKYSKKLVKKSKQVKTDKVSTRAWNGDTISEEDLIKFSRARDICIDKKFKSISNTRARADKFIRDRVKNSMKKSKKEFIFNKDGTVDFQFKIEDIVKYVSDMTVLIANLALNPSLSNFISMSYFLIRIYSTDQTFTSVRTFFTHVFDRYFTNDLLKKRKVLMRDYVPEPQWPTVTPYDLERLHDFIENPKTTTFPLFEGEFEDNHLIEAHVRMWENFIRTHPDMFGDAKLDFGMNKVYFKLQAPATRQCFVMITAGILTADEPYDRKFNTLLEFFNSVWHFHKWDATGGLTIGNYLSAYNDFRAVERIGIVDLSEESFGKVMRFVDNSLTNLSVIETKGNDLLTLFGAQGNRYDDVRHQGAKEELIDNFLKVVTNKDSLVFEDSEFGKASKKAMSIFTLAPFVMMAGGIKSLDQYDEWYEKRLGKADTAVTAISVFGNWLYTFLKSGLPYMISGDTIFLNPVKDFEKWLEISERVYSELMDKPTLTTIANNYDYDKVCTLVSVLSKSGRDLLKASTKIPYVAGKIQAMLQKLSTLYPILRAYFKGKLIRTAPLGIFIYGPSGAGKSSVVHSCINILAQNLGITDQKNAVYSINTNTKHLDGYREEQIGLLDDLGSANPNYSDQQIVANLCSICSEFAMITPQAELKDKGTIFYNFKAMIATSNFIDGGFREVMHNPSAGIRRFEVVIDVRVKTAHLLPNSSGQVNNNGNRIPISDLHVYNIMRPKVLNNQQYGFDYHIFNGVEMRDVDYKTMCRFLRDYHLGFMDRAERTKVATDSILSSKWCDLHQCLRHVCAEDGFNCNDEYVYQPQHNLNHLYQFNEIVNVREFDFKRFRDLPLADNMVEQCLTMVEKQLLEVDREVDPGIIGNIKRAIKMRQLRENIPGNDPNYRNENVVDGVEAIQQGWITQKIKGIVTYPVRSCIRTVINDPQLQKDLKTKFEETANGLVNTLTQEAQLQTITSNAVAAQLPAVTTLVKEQKKKLFDSALGAIGIAAGAIIGFFALYKCGKAFIEYLSRPVNKLQFSGVQERLNPDDFYASYKQTDAQIGAMQSERPPHPISRPMVIKPESLTLTRLQKNQQLPFKQMIDESIVEYYVQLGNGGKRSLGVMLGSNIMFTSAHGFRKALDGSVLKLIMFSHNSKYNVTISKSQICFFPGRDLCAFSTGHFSCKQIKRILPAKDSKAFEGEVELVTSDTEPDSLTRSNVKRYQGFYKPITYVYDEGLEYYLYDTKHSTKDGDCGSPIVATGDHASLIGLHCGYLPGSSKFLVRVYETDLQYARDWILKNCSQVTPNSFGDNIPGLEGIVLQSFKPGTFAEHIKGYALPVGWVKPQNSVKSKIRKSLVYDYIKDIKHKIPEFKSYTNFVLDTDVLQYVNPVLTKFRAIEDSPRMINPLLLEKARAILSDIMDGWCDWNDIRPASMHNVLNGIPGTISGGINLSTAPGPRYKVHLKRELVLEGDEPGQRMFKEEVYENIFKALKAYELHETAGFVSMWFPKDELITPEKEATGRQRYVSLTPFEKLVLTLMALKNVFIKIRESGKAHMAVGINAADPLQWGGFVDRMRTKDKDLKNLVDGDYKFYDAYIWFVTLILGMIINKLRENKWYNTKIRFYYKNDYVDMTMLEILTSVAGDVAQYFILVDGVMVFVANVTESGAACTAEINSVMESFLHILIYILCYLNYQKQNTTRYLTFDAGVSGLPDFKENVELINYGDDNFDCCTDKVKYFYNPETRTRAAKELGFPITDARKNPTLSFVEIHEIVFLKRRFRFDEELKVWMAPLDETSIRKLMAFVKGSSNTLEILTVNNVCDGHLQFYMYGRQKFEEEDMLLYIDLAQAGLTRYIKSWPDFDTLTKDYLKGVLAMGNL